MVKLEQSQSDDCCSSCVTEIEAQYDELSEAAEGD